MSKQTVTKQNCFVSDSKAQDGYFRFACLPGTQWRFHLEDGNWFLHIAESFSLEDVPKMFLGRDYFDA